MKSLHIRLALIYLAALNAHHVCGQDDFIKMMNDTIHSIHSVFEARIDSVQTFAGDEKGNPVPFGTAEWNGGFGNFDAVSYSKVWVSVCRQYKGKLPKKIIFLIRNPNVDMYAMVQPNGDTTLRYIYTPPSDGDYESPLMPSKSYPITNLYWCFNVLPLGKTGFYQLSKFCHFPMKFKGFIPNSDGHVDSGIIYAWTGLKTFMNQTELSDYLRLIKTLEPNPRSQCD